MPTPYTVHRRVVARAARTGALLLAVAGCGPDGSAKRTPAEPPGFSLTESVDMRWWVEKAARALRRGEAMRDEAELQRLALLDEGTVVETLMADGRFFDTVADFNLYVLGFKSDKLQYPDPKDPFSFFRSPLAFPQALEGARLLREGGDYLAMLSLDVPIPEAPLGPLFDFETGGFAKDPEATRAARYEVERERLAELASGLADGTMEASRYCELAYRLGLQGGDTYVAWPDHLEKALRSTGDLEALRSTCYGGGKGGVVIGDDGEADAKEPDEAEDDAEDDAEDGDADEEGGGDSDSDGPGGGSGGGANVKIPEDAPARLASYRRHFDRIVSYAKGLETSVYLPKSEAEVRRIDHAALGIEKSADEAMSWFWAALPNSSTNFDRKRANYVLKRFFCDDLTPLNIVLPESHAAGGDRHGSDPGCMSCHYKLDPMAGFFRYHGADGMDFRTSDTIYFDDGAKKPMAEYAAEWRDPRSGEWAVGFVRSATDWTRNDRGKNPADPTLADLFELLREAPEVKQCLVRRLFEYFVGERQAMDPGWLAELTAGFTARAAESSAAAFKETVQKLVTSRTFKTRDALSEECYDRAAESAGEGAVPCRIAYLVDKSCATCHRGDGAQGGLDLTRWTERPDGRFGFPHRRGDEEVDSLTTLRAISERLNESDPKLKMPLDRDMPATERDALYLWIERTLTRAAEGAR